jgi:2-polyprenyl-6-methoxyphenol hydroxylase-like FAD-dependent oxidoreductase
MATPSTTTVLIVGAGPVGLTLALLLDRAGVGVTVIDRDLAPVQQSRAIWVHSRTLEIWSAIGMTPLARAEGREVNGVQMNTSGRARAALKYDGTGISRFPHGVMLEQSRTQSLLLSLVSETRIAFAWGSTITSLDSKADGNLAELTTANGNVTTIAADYVVGADGGASAVRNMIGVELEGGTYNSSFFLVDAIASTDLNSTRPHLNFQGRSTVAVLPLPGDGHFRLIGNLMEQSGEPAEGGYGRSLSPDEVKRLIAANSLPLTIESIGWSSTYRSHFRVASTFRVGRVMLVGDACHLHSPAGGLGMNTGIADAANLAWKLAEVVGGAPEDLLETYTAERRAIAQQVIRTSDRLFVLQADARRRFAFARRYILPFVVWGISLTRTGRTLAFRRLSGTFARYASPASSEIRRAGRLTAGDLMRLTGIASLDEGVMSRAGRHALVRIAANDPSWATSVEALAADRIWDIVDVVGVEARRLVGRGAQDLLVWIRPDRYIGWIGHNVVALEGELRRQLGEGLSSRKL